MAAAARSRPLARSLSPGVSFGICRLGGDGERRGGRSATEANVGEEKKGKERKTEGGLGLWLGVIYVLTYEYLPCLHVAM